MRAIGWFLILCLALAALRTVLALLVIAYVGLLLLNCITHPRETFGIIALYGFLTVLDRHFWATVSVIAALCIVGWLAKTQQD